MSKIASQISVCCFVGVFFATNFQMNQLMRFWCLLHMPAAKAQASLHIFAGLPEPLLLKHTKLGNMVEGSD